MNYLLYQEVIILM